MLSAVLPSGASTRRHGDCSDGSAPKTLYADAALTPLPTVNIARTLASKLCGRLDDAVFNAKVITTTHRFDVAAHVAAVLSMSSGMSLCLVGDLSARTALTIINVVTGLVFFLHTSAALSWDILRLLTKTFEFWFLFPTLCLNVLQWCLLFHDIRVAAFAWMGVMFILTLCIDANVYSRHLAVRFFVLAAPALFIAVVLTTARVPPDLHYRTYRVLEIDIDAVDLLVNGNLMIAYFTAMDVFHSRNLVFSHAPVGRIQCDIYYPICQLVPQAQRLQPRQAVDANAAPPSSETSTTRQLRLSESTATHGIDATRMLLPRLARLVDLLIPTGVLKTLGFVSLTVCAAWVFLTAVAPVQLLNPTIQHPAVSTLIDISFTCAIIFACVYAAHYQPQLLKRVTNELDTWFVSFQATVVTIGMCDFSAWDWHHVLPLVTMWIWCHWTVFFDAVPPVTRRRLAYTARFGLFTSIVLVVYAVALARTLYIAASHFPERDRVLVHFTFGGVKWTVKLMGFLASKLVTFQVWMVRFLWRELLRPTDAFKLIKRRVYFTVSGTTK